jgi:hypothetical protein
MVPGIGRADELDARSETGSAQDAHHPAALGAANLHDGAEFLVEQRAHQQLERAAAASRSGRFSLPSTSLLRGS